MSMFCSVEHMFGTNCYKYLIASHTSGQFYSCQSSKLFATCRMWNSISVTNNAVQRLPSSIATITTWLTSLLLVFTHLLQLSKASFIYTHHSGYGYLAAVAIPLELGEHQAHVSFNFEANYGLPPNDSYYETIDHYYLHSFDVNVTKIDSRRQYRSLPEQVQSNRYSRYNFYRVVVGYLNQFRMNGTACLLRMICEVTAEPLDYHNGLLGSILKVLFTPTASIREFWPMDNTLVLRRDLLQAEWLGRQHFNQHYQANNGKQFKEEMYIDGDVCLDYKTGCHFGILDMISNFY